MVFSNSKKRWGAALAAALTTFLAYLPLGRNGFANLDDGEVVVDNLPLRHLDAAFFKWAFTTFHMGNWTPLTWLTLALDYRLGSLSPAVYHWNNLALHLLNVVLVFFLARRLFTLGWGQGEGEPSWALPASFLAAGVFGLHPLHVESVAWASERKDVLYAFFYLAGLLVYLNSKLKTQNLKLFYCFLLFLLSLMSKPMAVSFPFVLLLLDAWPLKRWGREGARVFLEKIPLLALSLAGSILAYISQRQVGATAMDEAGTLGFRIMHCSQSLVFYGWKTLAPLGFSVLYPFPPHKEALSAENLAAFLLVAVLAVLLYVLRHRLPFLLICGIYYLVTVLPVLGLVQVGVQAAADRYAYLPTLGFLLLLAGAVTSRLYRDPILLWGLTAILLSGLGLQTWRQVQVWENGVTLWENAARMSPEPSDLIYWNLGYAYQKAGRMPEAMDALNRSIALNPTIGGPYNSRGLALLDLGRVPEAIGDFQKAISLEPSSSIFHAHLCYAYTRLSKTAEAIAEGKRALELDPQSAMAYNNLGVAYGQKGDWGQSREAFQKAVSLEPDNPTYSGNLKALQPAK